MEKFLNVTVWSCATVAILAMILGSLELFILACFVATLAVVAEEVNRPE